MCSECTSCKLDVWADQVTVSRTQQINCPVGLESTIKINFWIKILLDNVSYKNVPQYCEWAVKRVVTI